jgi:hypothetical protein
MFKKRVKLSLFCIYSQMIYQLILKLNNLFEKLIKSIFIYLNFGYESIKKNSKISHQVIRNGQKLLFRGKNIKNL